MEFKLYRLYEENVNVNQSRYESDYYLIDLEKKSYQLLGSYSVDQVFINEFFKILSKELICSYVELCIQDSKFEQLLESLGYKVA